MYSSADLLVVADNYEDWLSIERVMREVGHTGQVRQVTSREQFLTAVAERSWSVIVSNYLADEFNGLQVLELLCDSGQMTPVILFSSSVGEERAVEAIQIGARDFLLKSCLFRLPKVIERELSADDSRRKQQQMSQRLEEERSLLELILSHTSDSLSLYSVDPDGEFRQIRTNKAFFDRCESRGQRVTADMLRNKTIAEIVCGVFKLDQALVERSYAILRQILHTKVPWRYEECYDHSSGPMHCEILVAPVCNSSGSVTHILISSRDITDRKLAELADKRLKQKLAIAQKYEAIGALAGGIAHDFNNLLTSISGYSELMLAAPEDRNLVVLGISQIQRAAAMAQDLTRQIALFAQGAHDRKEIQLADVLRNTVVVLKPGIDPRIELRLEMESPGEGPTAGVLMGDASQLGQVFANLIQNAIQSIGSRAGTIVVKMDTVVLDSVDLKILKELHPGKYVRVTVSDTGPGIPPSVQSRVFEPFFTTKTHGTGLGLAIVSRIVEQHSGAVSILSGDHAGATFFVYLPLFQVVTQATQPENRGERITSG